MTIEAALDDQVTQDCLPDPGRLVMRNAWFAIAHTIALAKGPVRRLLFEKPIVVWRDSKGVLSAMEDRCCHRRAPLSAGKVQVEGLQCPYHGWIYDSAGMVVKIPTMGDDFRPPEICRVPSYPLVVRYGFVWVWWGARDEADPALIPDIPFIDPDGAAPITGTVVYDVPQELYCENILDLTHINYVHGGLLGDPGQGKEDITVEVTDEAVAAIRTSRTKPPVALAPFFGFPKTLDLHNVTRVFVRSGCAIATVKFYPAGWGLYLFVTNVPESGRRIRQDFAMVTVGPWWFRKLMPLTNGPVQKQDDWILKLQAPQYEGDDERMDKSVRLDAPTLKYRAVRRSLARRQAAGDFSYAAGWQGRDAAEILRFGA